MPRYPKPTYLLVVACLLATTFAVASLSPGPSFPAPRTQSEPPLATPDATVWASDSQLLATAEEVAATSEAAQRHVSARGGYRGVDGDEEGVALATETPTRSATSTPTATPTAAIQPTPSAATTSGKGTEIVAIATRYVGFPYRWGGDSPAAGFDCSGFTWYVYKQAGIAIPNHDLEGQLNAGPRLDKSELQPGDLVFFQNTYKAGLSHSGVYVGDGTFVHAVDERTGVDYGHLDSAYWRSRFLAGSRPR